MKPTASLVVAVIALVAIAGCEDVSKKKSPAESERAARRLLAEAAKVAGGLEAMERLGSLRATGIAKGASQPLEATQLLRFRQRQLRIELRSPILRRSGVTIADGDRALLYGLGEVRPRTQTGVARERTMLAALTHPANVVALALRRPPGALRWVDTRTVEVSLDDKLPRVRLTFDKHKRLVAKRIGTTTIRYSDHRRVGGLLLPHRYSGTSPKTKLVADFAWKKIEIDPPLTRAQILAPAETRLTIFKTDE